MSRIRRTRTIDLNDPKDARSYLLTLEATGRVTFQGKDRVKDLDDEEIVIAAAMVYMKFHKFGKDASQ